jgi:Right handed beta helix region
MGRNFNHIVLFPALAILAAFLRLPVVAAGPSDVGEGRADKPAVTMLRAGVTGAEIQKALDSLPDAGGEVILPAGDFRISRPIVLRRDNQSLCGAGLATILRLADFANCPVIIMGDPVDQPSSTAKHLLVSGLCIDGNRRHQQLEVWQINREGSEIHNNGITVQDVTDSAVTNVTCAHCRSGGLVTTLGVRRLAVQHFEAFDNEFDGLACYSTTDCQFADLYLHDNCDAGISLDLGFDHNRVTDAVLSGNDLGIFMRDSRDNQFRDISIHHSRHFGVFIAQSDVETPQGWRPVAHGECVDNCFMNLNVTSCGSAAFHVNDSTCTNNVVMDMPAGAAFHGESTPNKFE